MDDVSDLKLRAIRLLLFQDLLVKSFLYLISNSSIESGIGVEQNSIWFLLKDIIESFLIKFKTICN